MNFKKVRNQFPFLQRKYEGNFLAYLDNASTTQKPQVVIEAISDVYKNHYANIHRGVYDLSVEATEAYEGVRERVRRFINARDSAEIIFTRNATEAINLVARSLGDWVLGNGGEILLTQMEHHSNIVPWQMLAERQTTNAIKIKYIPIDKEGRLDLSVLDKLVTKRTKIVSLTLMSNVLGTINPVKRIIKKIRSKNHQAKIIVDAAQAAAHMRMDVSDLDCDFLVFSAHKMYGPSGVGVLWGKHQFLESMPPFLGGGDMILAVDFEKTTFNDLPWKYEAGTPNIADVIAYEAAIDFVESVGFDKIQKHEMELTKYALEQLFRSENVEIFGPAFDRERPRHPRRGETLFPTSFLTDRGPVIAFNIDGVHPHDVASILSSEAVAIRSGHHCAQPLMGVLGVGAVCRVSFGIYNTKEEVDRLMKGIEKVKRVFRLNTAVYRPRSTAVVSSR